MSIIDIYNINRIKKQVFQKSYTTDSPDKTQIITGVRSELLHNVFRSLCQFIESPSLDYLLRSVNFFFSNHRFYHHTGVRIHSVAVLFITLFLFLLTSVCLQSQTQTERHFLQTAVRSEELHDQFQNIFFFQDTEPVLFAITERLLRKLKLCSVCSYTLQPSLHRTPASDPHMPPFTLCSDPRAQQMTCVYKHAHTRQRDQHCG